MGSAGWFGHFEGPGGVGKFGSHARGSRMLAGFSLPAAGAAFQRALPKSCTSPPCVHPRGMLLLALHTWKPHARLCRLQNHRGCTVPWWAAGMASVRGAPRNPGACWPPTVTEGSANTGCQHAGCWFLPQSISPRGASGPLLVVRHAPPHPGLSFWDRSTSPGGGREPSAALPAPTCPQHISARHPPATF